MDGKRRWNDMTEDEEIMSIETGNELDIRVANEFMRGGAKELFKVYICRLASSKKIR